MDDPLRIVVTLALGLATGVLSAMFGVGGAVVSTPGIRALGATPLEAVGTTLPAILPSALSGTLRYRREGLVDRYIVTWVATTGTATALGASFLSHAVPGDGHLLMVATAGVIANAAYRVARREPASARAKPAAAPVATLPANPAPERATRWRLAVGGAGAGTMSGLLGLGGGVVLVPVFLEWIRLPIKRALANSLACVGALAVPSTAAHAYLGDIDWAFALPLAVAVIPGARVGAAIAIRASDRALRIAVAIGLGVLAAGYGVREAVFLV